MVEALKMVLVVGVRRMAKNVLGLRWFHRAVSVEQLTVFNGVQGVK